MRRPFKIIGQVLFGALMLSLLLSILPLEDWGFFGHRRINRLAVFTLPMELIPLYKYHIEFITEHAVDPDMRRYASKFEAERHYIDVDHWGEYPFPEVPRTWSETLQKYTELYGISNTGDTLQLLDFKQATFTDESFTWRGKDLETLTGEKEIDIKAWRYKAFFEENVLPQYYEEKWQVSRDSINAMISPAYLTANVVDIIAVDSFSSFGILPYHLRSMQRRLTKAFETKDAPRILQLSAEFGHYLADAHVPLHTTENYNGQLSNQVGIHAFWESRIPELFADEEFDYFVGKAQYIEDPVNYYWDIVLTSHTYVDSLLAYEKELRDSFAEDQQYCYEERNGSTVRVECREFAEAYHRKLGNQVESRMRGAIHAIGSAWYTCWVDAGQPDISDILGIELPEAPVTENLPEVSEDKKSKIRSHQ